MAPDHRQKEQAMFSPAALKAGMGVLIATMLLMAVDVYEEISGREDVLPIPENVHFLQEALEIGSVLGLGLFTLYLFRQLKHMARRDMSREQTLSLLRGQFGDVLEQKFTEWELTPAERDVTMLILKGLNVADIASARNTAPGTVKAQSTAVFRKVGVVSKSELLSLIIDEFLDEATPV